MYITTTVWNSFDDSKTFDELETERITTMLDPKYQQWVSEFNISQSYSDPSGLIRARELNEQYNYSNSESIVLNFLKRNGLWN
jgi:hypothetical protein